jgi:signal transduction histidine kinase/DNA-binding response OmpR family regulator
MQRLLRWLKPSINGKTLLAMVVPVAVVVVLVKFLLYDSSIQILTEHEQVDLTDEAQLNARSLLDAYQSLRTDCLVVANWPQTRRVLTAADKREPFEATADGKTVRTNLKTLVDDGGSLINLFQGSNISYLRVQLLDRDGKPVMTVDRANRLTYKPSSFEDAAEYFRKQRRKPGDAALLRAVYLPEPPPMTKRALEWTEAVALSAYARVGDVGYVALDINVADIYRFLRQSRRHVVFLTNSRDRVLAGTLSDDVGRVLPQDPVFAEPGEPAEPGNQYTFRTEYRRLVSPESKQGPPRYLSIETAVKRSKIELPRYNFRYFEAKVPLEAYEAWYAGRKKLAAKQIESSPVREKEILESQFAESVDAPMVELEFPIPNEFATDNDGRLLVRARLFEFLNADASALERVKQKLNEEFGEYTRQKDQRSAEFTQTILCDQFEFQMHRIPFDPENPDRHLGFIMGFGMKEVILDITEATRKALLVATVSIALVLLMAWAIAYWQFSYPLRRLTVAAEGIHQGNYGVELPRQTAFRGDEIGVLARAFGGMAEQVRSREQELHRLNADLDNQVKERTIELLEQAEELRAARDQALSAAKATDAFLATVSHELRTPLNHIGGYCQLLEMGDLGDDQREDLAKVQKAAEHLLNIINDILDVQKIKMGVLPINPESFNAARLVRETADAMQGMVRKNSNVLQFEHMQSLGTVRTDPQRFRQILINLISNASKFTKDGTITVAGHADADPNLVSISVRDTGIGMTAEQLQKLFQPFSKISDRAINPEGTGLGLVICKKLAERMGGDITVESEAGRGSTFTMTIQRYLSDAEGNADAPDGPGVSEDSQSQKPRRAVRGGPAAGLTDTWKAAVNKDRRTVLIIDDDPQACEMLSRFLALENLKILVAHSGTEGLSVAQQSHPAVIMLDVVMPGIDGWSTLAALKTDESTADIPVILVTMLDDERKGYALGASDYITKPVNGAHLAKIVERYCGRPGGAILAVDDNPQDREVVRRILERDGWTVVEAEHGRAALDKLDGDGLDVRLILLDLMMPVMDGFEFVEEMRKRNRSTPVPIIVMTAKDPTPSERERLNGLVEKVLQKGNFDRAVLLREVHHLLDGVESRGSRDESGRRKAESGKP